MAANISSSAFFRVIEEMQPTLLIDEADTFLKKRGELRGILNAGYTKETGFVMRVAPEMKSAGCRVESEEHEGNGASERQNRGSRLLRFSCWCPKVMASIGHLPETLADRCIRIRMQRKTPREQCQRLRDLDPALITTLRRQCVRFVADHALEIANARPVMPSGLNDREADLWEPLIVIGDLAGGRWRELARQAAVGLTESARGRNPIGSLLLDMWVIFLNARVDRMFSRTLAAHLNDLGDRSWAELKKAKVVDTLWLAKILHPYDIRSRTIWIGETHAKGYLKKDLEVLFHRYIPQSEIDALLAECDAEKAGDGDRKSDPPSSDSRLHDASARQAGATRDGEEKKDEPGEAQDGEAAAA